MRLFKEFRTWLGEGRFWLLIGMFITTGVASLVLQFSQLENALAFQNMLVLALLLGAVLIFGTRISGEQHLRWAAVLLPGIGLVVLGVVFFPENILPFMAGASGWMLVSMLLFGRRRAPMQYQAAVKAMRKGDYKSAVGEMDTLIKAEPNVPDHYRFRAELLRLWGKLGRARRDYEEMVERSTDDANRAVGYNGLAEIELQAKNYQDALISAQKAYDLAPNEWVTAYNLGMIADRLGDSELVIDSLKKALAAKVPDSRHRLLTYLWQSRAYARLSRRDEAQSAIEHMKKEKHGFEEWQNILADEQAAVLREVLQADVQLAGRLISDESNAEQLGEILS